MSELVILDWAVMDVINTLQSFLFSFQLGENLTALYRSVPQFHTNCTVVFFYLVVQQMDGCAGLSMVCVCVVSTPDWQFQNAANAYIFIHKKTFFHLTFCG